MQPFLPAGSSIAVLGARGTGKSTLAGEIASRLARKGLTVRLVDGLAPEQPTDGTDVTGVRVYTGTAPEATAETDRITLLLALDLPSTASQAGGFESLERADAQLRGALARARIPYAVIHGSGEERIGNAWRVIMSHSSAGPVPTARTAGAGWTWTCDKCSDPACEHRLFSDLVASRI